MKTWDSHVGGHGEVGYATSGASGWRRWQAANAHALRSEPPSNLVVDYIVEQAATETLHHARLLLNNCTI